jgi:hypothetical protein
MDEEVATDIRMQILASLFQKRPPHVIRGQSYFDLNSLFSPLKNLKRRRYLQYVFYVPICLEEYTLPGPRIHLQSCIRSISK